MPDFQTSAGPAADAEGSSASAAVASASVVALVHDAPLLAMFSDAVDSRRNIWRAENVMHAADLLVAAPYAVLVLDAALTGKQTVEFVDRLHGQFRDLPIIVCGRLDDEVALGPLISSGIVFRFLHKPVSVERAHNFIEAAVRRLDEAPVQRPAGDIAERLQLARMPAFRLPRIALPWRLIRRTAGATALLLALGIAAWGVAVLVERAPWQALDFSLPDRADRPARNPDGVAVQRLVDAAGVALSQGRLLDPADRSAVALYRAALARDPANAQARLGLKRVADELLGRVEQALLADDLAAAATALDSARSVEPEHPRLAFLSAQLAADARRLEKQAAEEALGGTAEAHQRAQRVASLLAVAAQRMQADKLVGGLDSAEAYLREARQAAPDDADVGQALLALSDTMLQKARQAWSDGNEPVARNWLQRAKALDVDPESVARFDAHIASARVASMVEDRSRLLALANQRLAQGRLLEPATDSARHYLDLLRAAEPAFPGSAETEALLAAKLLDTALGLTRDGRPAEAGHYLAAAAAAGARQADLESVRTAGAAIREAATVLPESAMKKIAHTSPVYPARAAARGTEGWVDIQFTVAADGTTRDATVVDASPAGVFDDAVLDAVRRWRYQPQVVSGAAVDQRVKLRLRFELDGG